MTLPMETPNPMFGRYLYPFANEFREKQQDIFWTAQEIPIEKDITDYRQKMDKYQFNLVTLTLQLFVEIEQQVGDIWAKIAEWFPHSEIEGAAVQISAMEKSVHAFFYQKMNDELAIEPETILANQEKIAVLRNKLSLLKSIMSNIESNKALTLFTVSMIEQVLLFSNFALLKSFKANGHNLIQNTLVGVDFVINDETLHGLFAGKLYKQYIAEMKESIPSEDFRTWYSDLLQKEELLRDEIILHEDAIINYVFEEVDSINDITPDQMKTFIRSRSNEVTQDLSPEITPYNLDDNPIAEWFYKGASSIKMHDFFVAGTSQYRRNWKAENLSLKPFLKELTNE